MGLSLLVVNSVSLIIEIPFPKNSIGPTIILNIFSKKCANFNLSLIAHVIIEANKARITNIFNMLKYVLLKNRYVLLNISIGTVRIYAFLFFIFPSFSKTYIVANIVGIANKITDIPTLCLKNNIECHTLNIKESITAICICFSPFFILLYFILYFCFWQINYNIYGGH